MPNWAFSNDGSLTYEDNESSWYSDMETVHAVAGIDVDLEPARQDPGIYTRECIVALVDTGVDITHPALAGGLWKNPGEIPGDGIDNDGNGFIDDVDGWNFYKNTNVVYNSRSSTEDAHGTHCAGTVIADGASSGVTGIAGGIEAVRLMPVKTVGGPDQTGTIENLIKGIQYAEQNGARICNISLAFEKWNEEVYEVIKASHMLFVTVAGNGGSDTHGSGTDLETFPRYPACYGLDNVIVVANLKCDGTLHYSSNYSAVYTDLAAPGTKIYGTSTHKSGYEEMTGTSMAAPMVSAAAALTYASHEDWDILQVRQALLTSARKQDALEGLVKTGGMLDVAGAVFYKEQPPEEPDLPDKPETGTEQPSDKPGAGTEQPPQNPGEVQVPEAEQPVETKKPVNTKKPAKPKVTCVVSYEKNHLSIAWKKVKGAGGYEVSYAKNQSFTKNKLTKKTKRTALDLKLKEGKTYFVRVRAYAGTGKNRRVGAYSTVCRIKLTARPAGSGRIRVKRTAGKLTVASNPVKGADGYEITVSADRAGKKIVAQKKSVSGRATFKKLKKKKVYYVTARAYRKTKWGRLYGREKIIKTK